MAYELAPDLYRISTERRSRISVWSDTPAPHPAPGTVGRPGRQAPAVRRVLWWPEPPPETEAPQAGAPQAAGFSLPGV
jgi:hypothetical protein